MRARKLVIPAAGLGTRFLPATKAIPKEMLTIVDKPSIQYVVEEAIKTGLEDLLIITGRNKSALEDYFDKAYELEKTLEERGETAKLNILRELDYTKVTYTRQGEPLGLGHAILQAESHVNNEPFVVMLPDELIADNGLLLTTMLEHQQNLNATVIALMEVPETEIHKYGCVKISNDSTGIPGLVKIEELVEKPKTNAPSNLAVIGRYVIKPQVFNILKTQPKGVGGEIQLTDALNTLAQSPSTGGVYGVIFKGKRYDTGDKLGYMKANIEFALQNKELSSELIPWLKGYINE
jgi:UTP--glucose-1-phosphate uridylyltransferase